MIDLNIQNLVKSITKDKQIDCLLPLLDRLEELNDFRYKEVHKLTGNFINSVSKRNERHMPSVVLTNSLFISIEDLFWIELLDKSLIETIKEVNSILKASKEPEEDNYEESSNLKFVPSTSNEFNYVSTGRLASLLEHNIPRGLIGSRRTIQQQQLSIGTFSSDQLEIIVNSLIDNDISLETFFTNYPGFVDSGFQQVITEIYNKIILDRNYT